jgi:dihydroorotase
MRLALKGLRDTKGHKLSIQLENGKIVGFGEEGDEVLDFSGKVILPGFLDMKANLCEPGYEHKEDLVSGLSAARRGGFTAVCQVPCLDPILDSKNGLSYLINQSAFELTDVLPIAALTKGLNGNELSEHFDLNEGGAVAFSQGYKSIRHTGVLLKALQYVQPIEGLIISNPYDSYLTGNGLVHEGVSSTAMGLKGIPSMAESIAIERDLEVLRYTGGRLHFSGISTSKGVDLIATAKEEGLHVTADVHALNLMFNDSTVSLLNTDFKVFPPLRSEKDRLSLIKGIKKGTIDAIVSNHQPHEEDCKKLEYDYADFGAETFETVLGGLLTFTDLSLKDIKSALSDRPREILGIDSITFEEGEELNATIVDIEGSVTFSNKDLLSKSKNNPLLGKRLSGNVVAIFNKGVYQQY